MFYGRVDKLFDLRESHYLVEFLFDLSVAHTQDRAVQENILPTSQFLVKARAHFQKRSYPAVNIRIALSWFSDSRKNLEQCAFARTVATDNAYDLAVFDFERDTLKRPNYFIAPAARWQRSAGVGRRKVTAQVIAFSLRSGCIQSHQMPGCPKRRCRSRTKFIAQSPARLQVRGDPIAFAQTRNVNSDVRHSCGGR